MLAGLAFAAMLPVLMAGCGGDTGAPVLVNVAPSAHAADIVECRGGHGDARSRMREIAPPAGGWSGAPQAVVMRNQLAGEVTIAQGERSICGNTADARTLDSRFRAGVGTVVVPAAGDRAPIEVRFSAQPLPLWPPVIKIGEPARLQRDDAVRFAVRVASIAVVMTLLVSALLTFLATGERAYLAYAGTAGLFAMAQAVLSGLWAWPRPWLPLVGVDPPTAAIVFAFGAAATTLHALLRQMPWRLSLGARRAGRAAAWLLALSSLLLLVLPDAGRASASVAIEVLFYIACAVFAAAALVSLVRSPGRDSAAMLAGVTPFVVIGVMQASSAPSLAPWKVEAFLVAGAWLATTCSMVLTQRLGRLRRQRDEMRRLAETDPLTGLQNRATAMRALERAVAAARARDTALTVAFIDLDHFKQINDTHGHAVGDRVLKHFASMLRGAFRQADHVGRIGGEEFLAILPGADPEHAHARVDTLRSLLRDSGALLGVPGLEVTTSIGIGALEPGDADGAALLRRADEAMYAAKRDGRDRVRVAAG